MPPNVHARPPARPPGNEAMHSLVPRPSPAPVFDCMQYAKTEPRRPGESYHVIRATGDVTDSTHGGIFTFLSSATEKLKKQDKFQPRDKS